MSVSRLLRVTRECREEPRGTAARIEPSRHPVVNDPEIAERPSGFLCPASARSAPEQEQSRAEAIVLETG